MTTSSTDTSAAITVGITGASGMIGSALVDALTKTGHTAVALPRPNDTIDEQLLATCDAVVNLAGKPIAGRFTTQHKKEVLSSREDGTTALATAMARLYRHDPDHAPSVLVSASAAGYYGHDRGDEVLTEQSGSGDDFLAMVCRRWEAAADPARDAGLRVVHVRTGIVQSAQGGQLNVQLPLFKLGLGGPLSLRGRQWTPWVSLVDMARLYLFAVVNPNVVGPINAVAPGIVRNKEYARVLGEVIGRPAIIPVPCWGPALLLNPQGARELACAGQRMTCDKVQQLGFKFRHQELDHALRDELT